MKKMIGNFPFLALFFLILPSSDLSGQSLYDEFFQKGKTAYEALDFEEAINQFKAAKIARGVTREQERIVDEWIEKAQTGYIDAIKRESQKALEAQAEAQKQAEIANLEAQRSEANRLAFLAMEEIKQGNKEDALTLAFMAYQKVENDPIPQVKQSFGDAVFAYFHKTKGGEGDPVLAGRFAPDGSGLLTVMGDRTATFWDLNGKPLYSLKGHTGPISTLTFAPDGHILTGSQDKTIRLWSPKGEALATLSGHTEEVTGLACSSDGQFLLSWSRDQTARLWDRQGNLIATLEGHQAPVLEARISSDGQHILTRSADRSVRVWDIKGALLTDKIRHDKHIYAAVFSPDGKTIATTSADGTTKTWSLDGTMQHELTGHTGLVPVVCFSQNGQLVLTAGTDGQSRLWNASTGTLVKSISAHSSWITAAGFNPSGTSFFTVSRGHSIKYWDPEGNQLATLAKHTDAITSAIYNREGDLLMSCSRDGTAKVWDQQGNVIMNQEGLSAAHVTSSFSPDGQYMLTIAHGQQAFICPVPAMIYAQLKKNPPPPLSEEKRERYGVE